MMQRTLFICSLLTLAGCQAAERAPVFSPTIFDHNAPAIVDSHARLLPPTDPPASADEQFIDLQAALVRAGYENPTIALAQEAVSASQAGLLQAQALLLPNLNAGSSFNWHDGNLQTGQGAIIDVERQSAYVGAGAFAVGAGTVGIPGVYLVAHPGDAIYQPQAARYQVTGRQLDALATRNAVLLDVARRYYALVGAQARLQAMRQSEADLNEIVKLTTDFASTGQGREADAQRAQSEALLTHAAADAIQEEAAVAAAELAKLLSMDAAIRIRVPGGPVPILQLVDLRDGLDRLVQIALLNRPEIGARSADVAMCETRLQNEKVRPLLPILTVGFSAGGFGGGGSQADTSFGHFNGRTDLDAAAYWSLENFGFGNLAVQRQLRAQVGQASAERQRAGDTIRTEVADAFAASVAREGEMNVALRRMQTAQRAFTQDLLRARNLQGHPIEVLDSARLLTTARQAHLKALVGYNQAQIELFVSLGQPPR